MGRFGLSILEARRCTPIEFRLYSLAHRVKQQEQERLLAHQAWLNQAVQATENIGNKSKPKYVPKFKSFDEFYDDQVAFFQIFDPTYKQQSKQLGLADLNRLINRRKEATDG